MPANFQPEAKFTHCPFPQNAESGLASCLHETLIALTMDGHQMEQISRDATETEAREKPAPKPKAANPKRRRKRGRLSSRERSMRMSQAGWNGN